MQKDIHHHLLDLYAEWGRLTEIEGKAIGNDEWASVAEQQLLKKRLQDQIVQTAGQWQSEQGETEVGWAKHEREFRPIISDLIQRESQNHELLCQRREHLQARLGSLKQSGAYLRGIHRTYAASNSSNWQSYS